MDQQLALFLSAVNFQIAWQKVFSNQGCAGVDQETIEQFSQHLDRNLSSLLQSVTNGTYRSLPLRQIFIPKKDQSWRELRIPTVRDRIAQQALLNVLHPVVDPQFETCSFAYRPGRSHRMAVDQVSAWYRRGYQWVLDADIVQYFDHIEHQRLLAEVAERLPSQSKAYGIKNSSTTTFTQLVIHLIEQWISVGVLTPQGLFLPEQGVPQGCVVSPILANVYLDDFDEAILQTSLKLVRYADDFLILGRRQKDIFAAQQKVIELFTEIGLQLNAAKTKMTHFQKGFRFLGHTFVGDLVVPIQRETPSNQRIMRPNTSALRIVHGEVPSSPSQLQRALVDALKKSQKPIPPPLFVVMGYQIREEKRVEIISEETVWRQGMSTLYLVQQGATVNKEHGRFLVKAPKEILLEVPTREVKQVLVFGNIQLTTAVISECLENQIPVLFLSQLGDYKGHLWSAEYDDIQTEMSQFQRQGDEMFRLTTARSIVVGKLLNSRQLLLRLNRKRQNVTVMEVIDGLSKSIDSVGQADSLNVLRGHEGAAAAGYFKALGLLIVNEGFVLAERNRRPPKDPVNSLLSFGYTLLFNNVLSLILAEGLNPYLGNLHGSEKKKTFLAFDLMEEFRSPVVDSLVIRLINQKFFKPTDFTWPDKEGGIYLNETAKRPFLKHFEKRLSLEIAHPDVQSPVSYRRAIQLQIRRYKQGLFGDVPYEAYRKVN